MRTTSAAVRAALAGCLLALAAPRPVGTVPAVLLQARAEDDWSAEFEAVCSRTQDAMGLTSDELRALVARCDRLAPRLAALDESRRKVYGKRLQQCRDLYEFVLRTREKG